MILGQFPAGIYFQVSSIFTLFTLILIYWISQYYGHDKPFPQTWISTVANHFPEYIFFRTATISGSVLMALGWIVNHYYLMTIGYENTINMHKYKLNVMLAMGVVGACFLMGSTANIDTAKNNEHWHTFCASKFFILTVFGQIYNTVVFTHLWYNYKIVNQTLVYLKLFNFSLMLIQAYLSVNYGLFENYNQPIQENNLDNNMGIFLEWTLTLTVLFGFLLMSLDVKNFKLVYQIDGNNVKQSQYKKSMEHIQ